MIPNDLTPKEKINLPEPLDASESSSVISISSDEEESVLGEEKNQGKVKSQVEVEENTSRRAKTQTSEDQSSEKSKNTKVKWFSTQNSSDSFEDKKQKKIQKESKAITKMQEQIMEIQSEYQDLKGIIDVFIAKKEKEEELFKALITKERKKN